MNTHTRAITGCSYWRGLTWNSLPEWWWLCYSSSTPSISVAPLHLLLLLYCHSSSPSPLLLLHPLSLFCFIFEFVPSLQWNSTNTLILFFSHPVSLIYFLRVPSLLSPSSLPPPFHQPPSPHHLAATRREVVKVFGEFLLTKPTLPGCCLSTWNSSTQIRLGFLTRREGKSRTDRERELLKGHCPFKDEVSFFPSPFSLLFLRHAPSSILPPSRPLPLSQ